MMKIGVLTAAILILMIVPTSIYALGSMEGSAKSPEEIALDFIKNSPTFRFDGITSTLKVEDVIINKSNPPQYAVTLVFSCLHGGFGDRTGMIVTEAITPHTAFVTVVEEKVVSATIDGVWDEMAQETVIDQQKAYVEAIALRWLINAPTFKFDGVVGSPKVTDSFLAMTFAAPSFWGVTIEFDCLHSGYGDRTGQMLAQVITHHVVTIHVTGDQVTLAQIDDKWDELKQTPIKGVYTSETATETAISWLFSCPTFKFDGVAETVKVIEVMPLRMLNAWVVSVNFTCQYPGYGDRTGNVMYGHSQTHTIKISVVEGQVTRAIIDEVWDEVEQVMLDQGSSILSPEEARDIAVNYVVDKFGLEPAVFNIWLIQDLTPHLLGVQKTLFTCGDWKVTVENAVVWKPTYDVTVEYGEVSWVGRVEQTGDVFSDEADVPQLIYTPDIARKLCIDYLLVNHPEVVGVLPSEWVETNLVPDGLVGVTRIQYSSGGWNVTVSGPVVWKPTYEVVIMRVGDGVNFVWKGIVPQGSPVQETSFSK